MNRKKIIKPVTMSDIRRFVYYQMNRMQLEVLSKKFGFLGNARNERTDVLQAFLMNSIEKTTLKEFR